MLPEGGEEEEAAEKNELPKPEGFFAFLNTQAWTWSYVTSHGVEYTDVFESIKVNGEHSKGTTEPFSLAGKTYDLKNMTVSFNNNTYKLEKTKRNIRKRPDGTSKGGKAGLVGSDSANYEQLFLKFLEKRGSTSISEIMWGLMDHYLQYMLPNTLKTINEEAAQE